MSIILELGGKEKASVFSHRRWLMAAILNHIDRKYSRHHRMSFE